VDQDEIGTLGQDIFKTWCTPARATAIPASQDKHGWDFYVQMSVSGGWDEPLERSFKVQVKTTENGNLTSGIKLSNWKRMALERIPWFVLHLVVEEARVCAAYLVHVDEHHVARVLAKLRSLADSTDLRKRKMVLTVGEAGLLGEPFHDSFRAAVLHHLGESEEAYGVEKSSWIKKTGFEERPYTYTLTTLAADAATLHRQRAEWAVGLLERLPLSALKVTETRFGITKTVKEAENLADAYVEFNGLPSLGTTSITLSDREQTEAVTIACSTHLASMLFPDLPPEHNILRFVAPFVSFLSLPKNETFAAFHVKFKIPGKGAELPLRELSKVCKCVRLLTRAQEHGLRADFILNNVSHSFGLGNPHFEPDPEFLRLVSVVEAATSVAKFFDLDMDTIVDPGDLLRREFQVLLLAAGFEGTVATWDLRFGAEVDETVVGKMAAASLMGAMPLGQHVISAGFVFLGRAVFTRQPDGTATVGIDKPSVQLAFKQIIPRRQWTVATARSKMNAFVQNLGAEGVEILIH
jgi:hypothetical protein